MPFQILDNDEVTAAPQSVWMQSDIDALVAGIGASGVLTGCAVTAQGSPNMTCAVAAGEVLIGGTKALVAAGNVTITTANATNPRIDLVVVDNTGTKSVTAGTAAASPKAPDIPANSVLLAMVYVPATDTAISSDQITDKRLVLRPRIPEGRAVNGGTTTYWTVPGCEISGQGTRVCIANRLQYEPVYVTTPITLDRLTVEVTVAGSAGTTIRLGIYHADTAWQPTTLVVDGGTVPADGTIGVKSVTINTTLQPGRYLFALHSDSGATVRLLRGGTRFFGLLDTLGTSAIIQNVYVSTAYAVLASTGVAWTVVSSGTTAFDHAVVCRVSTP